MRFNPIILPLFAILTLALAWLTVSASSPTPSPFLLFSSSPLPASPARLDSNPVYLPLIQIPFTPPTQDHLLITEIMASPLTGQVEWVELYNRTTAPIDLSGYKIGDEETLGGPEAMRQFPPGAVIQPDQVILLAMDANIFQATYGFLPDYEIVNTGFPVPDLFDYFPWASGQFSLAGTGDELLLLDFFDNPVDSVAWGDSDWIDFTPPAVNPDQGFTLERFPAYLDTNTASDWRESPPDPGGVDLSPPLPTPTPDLTPTPFGGGLLISEVLYDPTGDEPNAEWIELYNATGQTLALLHFKIGDEEASGESEGMYHFPGGTLGPSGVVIIANRASDFQLAYNFSPDYELTDTDPDVPDMVKYTAWAGGSMSLTNTGDEILLLDYYDTLVDAVSWGNSTFAFDPSAPLVPQGTSLERRPPYADTDTAADWQPQPSPTPGTVDLSTPTPTPTLTPTLTLTPTPTPFSTGLYLSEVLYNPTGTEPNAEWIEIYNATGTTLDLTNFKVGDEETPGGGEGMYRFPTGTTAEPGAVLVIANRAAECPCQPDFELTDTAPNIPDMVKYTAWANGNMNLANTGDEVLLVDYNDVVIDALSWGNSTYAFDPPAPAVEDGHSLERVPADIDTNTANDWQDQPTPAPGTVNLTPPTLTPTLTLTPTPTPTPTLTPTPTPTPTPFTGLLLISEVLYDHVGTEPTGEWIEIYNATGSAVDLTNFKVGDEETQGDGEGMYRFPDGTTLPAGETFIIANQATIFFAGYGFTPDFELSETDPAVPNLIAYSPWASGSINLANAGDEVLLLDPGNNLVDAVSWGTSTWAFNPPVPGVSEGHSIERVPANVDTNTNVDWVDQASPDPGNVNLGGEK